MQKTRQKILEYVKQHGEATVDELSLLLGNLTPVTVRHHLDVMRSDGLIQVPEIRHRSSPGRPQYVYRLTEKAEALFPNNLQTLADSLVEEMKDKLDEQQVNMILQGVAERMAAGAAPSSTTEAMEARLDRVVAHLVERGYLASWERQPEGFVLYTSNCPYGGIAVHHPEMCALDIRYISALLGVVPRRLMHATKGDASCSYLIAYSEQSTTA